MTAPHESPSRRDLDDPDLLPFLPMIYVAWADGELAPAEIEAICPEGDCRPRLLPWLDPADPPSAAELGRILRIVRTRARDLDTRAKLDLTGLGVALAQAHREDDLPVSAAEREALERIEESLGIDGTEAARQLLASRRPAQRAPEPDPDFDVEALETRLAGRWPNVRRRVLDLVSTPEMAVPLEMDRAAYREQVLAWCRRLADEGFGGLSYPEAAGGSTPDGDLGAFITAFETLAFHDLSLLVKFGVQFGLFGGAILNLGTERHHRELLPRVARLELPGCFAMTETGHGSNVADLETTAVYDAATEEFEIHTPSAAAVKDYIGNAAVHGRMAVVFAQLRVPAEGFVDQEQGVHAFVVPIREEAGAPLPGVTIEDDGPKMGLNGVDNGRLRFDHVRIPRTALLDRFAQVDADGRYESPIASPSRRFFTMLGTLVGGRVSVALGANSASKSALVIAVRYAVRRRQFGPGGAQELKLIDYPSHQRRLLPRLATTYALHFALDRLRTDYVESEATERREIELDAAGLKALSTWHCTDTIQACREACGGQGYLAENRFAALKADTDVFTTFEGDNTVLLLLVAKGMLTALRKQFAQAGVRGLARWLGERVKHEAKHLDPVTGRRTSDEHLLDRDFHLDAFRWREDELLTHAAGRLKSRLDDGEDAAVAMLAVQNDLLEAARARVELQILERFAAAVDATEDATQQGILRRLCDLYALVRLEADRAFFLEHCVFEPSKARAIRDLVTRLCADLRPQAKHLVDAFGIPGEVLDAPIAR